MKNGLKKIIGSFLIILILISNFILCFGVEFDINAQEQGKEYKKRKFTVNGVEDTILTYNDEIFFSGENKNVTDNQKKLNNYIALGISIFLIVYWVILLFIFEKEETCDFTFENIDDFTTLKKYNPMIAGCIADNRQVLPRDIIAIVLNLIKKDYIKMEMIPNYKDEKENYIYMISENKEKQEGLDKSESFVLSLIFGVFNEEKVDLVKRLKELSKSKEFKKNMDKLNIIAEEELNKIGANMPKVPLKLRVLNIMVSLFTVVISMLHILNNGLNIHIYESTIFLFLFLIIGIIVALPLIALIIHLILFAVVLLKKMIKTTSDKYSGKQIVQTSSLVLVFMFIIIAVLYFIVPNKYICLDVFMVGMSFLIVKTDNLMTKHNKEVLNDYYALNEIKFRISEYSLIKDEQINYIKLWDEYLIYAVTFGIPIPIINKLKGSYKEDEDIAYLAQCEALYYVCKAYLEVMWEMKFKRGTKLINLDGLFNKL